MTQKQNIKLMIASLAIIPFLLPFAYFPINKFISELFSILVALIIIIISTIKTQEIKVAPVSISCFLFAVFAIIQPIFININLPSINLYLLLLFITLALFSTAITTIISKDQRISLLESICWGLLISGVIQSIIGYIQFANIEPYFQGLIMQSSYNDGTGSNIFGNIGQRNQYIDLLSTAVMAVSYLFYNKKISLLSTTILFSIYNIAITLCAGRTVFAYFAFYLLIAVIMLLIYKNNINRFNQYKKLTNIIVFYMVLLITTEIVISIIMSKFSTATNITTGIARFSSEYIGQSTYRRFYEWYKALILFARHPLLGVGWFQYPKQAVYMMLEPYFYYIPANKKLYSHCHNSILNIMAETGIIGTAITIGYGIIYSLYKVLKQCEDGLIILALSSPILIHSVFEYPLWYNYFLVIFIFLLSFAPPVITISKSINFYKTAVLSIVLILSIIAYQVSNQAYTLLTITSPTNDEDSNNVTIQKLENIVEQPYNLLSYDALLVLDSYLPRHSYSLTDLKYDMKFIDLLGEIAPFPFAIYKQMVIHHIVGDEKQSLYYANLLTHAYPALQDDFLQQLQGCNNCSLLQNSIKSFQYQDKSPFARWFDASHHKQSY